MDENNGNFIDKNTLLAIGLSIIFFIGWQFYIQKKYPEKYKNKVVQTETTEIKTEKSQNLQQSQTQSISQDKVKNTAVTQQKETVKTTIFEIETKNFSGQLSSSGMGLVLVALNNYSDRDGEKIQFSNNDLSLGNFATFFEKETPNFKITKEDENTYIGTALVSGATLVKKMIIHDESYTVDVTLNVVSGAINNQTSLKVLLSNQALKVKSSFLTPAYEGTEFFAINDGDEERERIDIESTLNQPYSKTTLASIGSQYFAVALKDKSEIIPSTLFTYKPQEQVVFATVSYNPQALNSPSGVSFTGFIGPKKYDILKSLDPNFVQMINYGIFSVLSKPILTLLKWLYGLFQNWGLAIILLTVFIRMLLLPINISSLRSMKKMQKIQPQLKSIKEKYKDDPARVNQETMALMKKEKANPLGGCLPMLLQLPVFFALYSVLGQSVELYKAPFAFWIQDLSYQDPYFVLPIAVGLLYFVQMNITPQTGMDPTQAKVMKFIPILFCFFMITVPSGLTLYFFVNTIFGIGQQFIFQKEKRKAAA